MKEYWNSTKFFSGDAFKFITPVDCGTEVCRSCHDCHTVRKYWLLHYVVSGKGEYTVGGKTYYPKEGQIFIIRPSEIVYYKADEVDPWEYVWVGFKLLFDPPSILAENYVIDGTDYQSVFSRISEYSTADRFNEAGCYGVIWELVSLMNSNSKGDDAENNAYKAVKKAKQFIELHYSRKISVAAIAEMLHLDRSYFYVIFKKNTGQSPQEYINKYRLKMAAQYLKDGMSPGKTAAICGYSDVFNFSKMFKKEYGVSPSAYAKT